MASVDFSAELESNEIALSILEEQIQELEEDVREMEEIINSNTKVTNALIINCNKKKKYLEILQKKRISIKFGDVLDKSFGLGLGDRVSKNLSDKTKKYEGELEHINSDSKNRFVRSNREKLEKDIEKLKKKQGYISKIQRTIVNSRLKSQIRKERRNRSNEIIADNIESFKRKYYDKGIYVYKDKAQESKDDGKFFEAVYYRGAALISSAKLGVLTAYCNTMKVKNIIIKGACNLPSYILDTIKKKINNSGRTR